ncbi:hypothetical protein STVA_41740 [Allostella vacuolata]|nr:hypothetical protein STVA_41740 [Stella vacuolata]
MPDALPRFDGAAIWVTLSPEHQAAIGAAVLEMVAAENVNNNLRADRGELGPRYRTVSPYLDSAIACHLRDAIDAAVPDEAWESDGLPAVPSLAGPLCRECGCGERNACVTEAGPCHWFEPDLCSACVPEEAPHA